ncbi:MAG: tetratricopeptide repeat protein [Limisphaerales bacterium]
MKIIQILFRSLLLSAAFIPTGWAEGLSINCVDFQKIEINGRPARMVLITSLPASGVLDSDARRLGLKTPGTWEDIARISVRISELTPVEEGGQTFTAPMLVARLPWWARLASHFCTIPADGAVGWPEVRDNILVFDSRDRVIRRAEHLPPETCAWLKCKVLPDDYLLLELPLADGGKGIVWVDTAESQSVMVPPAQWKEWKAAYPHPARGDEIKLGALTLTGVAVKEMSAGDAKDLLNETPAATAVWKLGMAALTRLDLVVDGKNGWAYVHPKPPEWPRNSTNSPAGEGDWKVAENVRLSSDNLFVYAGMYKQYKNDFTGALADFNHALELNPRNSDAYADRGAVREVQGDFSAAVADYDKVIELRPERSEWQRLYRRALLLRMGRLAETGAKPAAGGKEASESMVALEPVVVYAVRPKGAAASQKRWVETLELFLAGKLDEKELLALARKSDGELPASEQKALANYYIGMVRLSKGDQAGARECLQKCRGAGLKDDDEYFFSGAELARMDAPAPR